MNGWLKALLTVAALVVIGFGVLLGGILGRELWRDATRGIETSRVVNVDPESEAMVEHLSLSGFERVGDGPVLRAHLYVEQDFEVEGKFGSYSKSSSQNAINMLFVEPGAPDRWLFASNDQLIYQAMPIALVPIGERRGAEPEVATMLFLVPTDTNADLRLTSRDRRSLALMQPDGRGLVILIEDLAGEVSVLPDPVAIVLAVEGLSGIELLRIDPKSFDILDRRTVNYPK